MRITLVNESKTPLVTAGVLQEIAKIVERQLYEEYAVLWQSAGCPVGVKTLAQTDKYDCIVAILDTADQADALGYHDCTPDGRPYAKVFLQPILDSGGTLTSGANSLSVTVSHEVLEIMGDVYANFWADGPKGVGYALELCDPVENDYYNLDGIAVSNFVGPRWFRPGAGPYDWLSLLKAPFTMTEHGYMIQRLDKGRVYQVYGKSYPEWKKAGKAHKASRTSKRLRGVTGE